MFFEIRFIHFPKVVKNIDDLNSDIDIYFIQQIIKFTETPVQLLLLLKTILPAAEKYGMIALDNLKIIERCGVILMKLIKRKDSDKIFTEKEYDDIKQLYIFIDPYIENAVQVPEISNDDLKIKSLRIIQFLLKVFSEEGLVR